MPAGERPGGNGCPEAAGGERPTLIHDESPTLVVGHGGPTPTTHDSSLRRVDDPQTTTPRTPPALAGEGAPA